MRRPRHRFGTLVGLTTPIGVAALLLLAPAAANEPPQAAKPSPSPLIVAEFGIPDPQLPSPNAFTYYAAAGRAAHDGRLRLYTIEDTSGLPGPRPRLPADDPVAVLREKAPALRLLRQGFAYPYHEPPPRSFEHLQPHLGHYQSLAQLLTLEAGVRLARGDRRGAAASLLDGLRLSADIARGATDMGWRSSNLCHRIARQELWRILDRLDAAEAWEAARRLETINGCTVPLWRMLEEEKWYMQAGLIRNLKHSDLSLDQQRALVRGVGEVYDDLMTRARRSWSPSERALPGDRVPEPAGVSADAADITAGVRLRYHALRAGNLSRRTQNALLCAALAVRAYYKENGHYPSSLAEVAPVYVRAVPEDPYAPGHPLRYNLPDKLNARPVLYSVGPDGEDNAGYALHKDTPQFTITNGVIKRPPDNDVVAGVTLR